MKKVYVPLFMAMIAAGSVWAQTPTKPLVLTGHAEYYLKGVSRNGEWAYGAYLDYNDQAFGFRWNLKNNKIEMLSRGAVTSEPSGISNDGSLPGFFLDNAVVKNGAYVHNEGLYKNGKWTPMNVSGIPTISSDRSGTTLSVNWNVSAISNDGKHVGGACADKRLTVWNADGTIDWQAENDNYIRVYCLSDDGTMASGWRYQGLDETRMPFLWKKDGTRIDLPVGETYKYNLHPWHGGIRFAANDRYLLYWGNYKLDDAEKGDDSGVTQYGVYDVANDKVTNIPAYLPYSTSIFYRDITDDGVLIGMETGAFNLPNEDGALENDSTYLLMYDMKQNKFTDFYKYLEEKGVDFSSLPLFSSLDNTMMQVSGDGKTFALRYFGVDNGVYPLIIKLDENVTSRPPVQFTANRVVAADGVLLEWLEPLAGAEGVKSYKVYRDGQLIATTDAQTLRYTDGNVKTGETHTYVVKAQYADVESEASDAATITLSELTPHAPNSLFARQCNQAQAFMEWNTPKSNLATRNYYSDTDEVTGFGGGSNNFEVAISLPADELALYKNHKLTAVSFYPMSEQQAWTLNIYSHDPVSGEVKNITSQPITQTLLYGKPNRVALATPVDFPAGKDLYVGVAVKVNASADFNVIGEVNGVTTPTRSDLIRQTDTGEDFYSIYQKALETGYSTADTWAIDAILTPDNVNPEIDHVVSYDVYVDGQKTKNTSELNAQTDNLTVGNHTLGVVANYADGRRSDLATTTVAIEENENYFQAITPSVVSKGENGATFNWESPKKNDMQLISYAYGDFGSGMATGADAYWNLLARAEYQPRLFKGMEGHRIVAGRFYPLCDAIYTLSLYADGVKVAEKEAEKIVPNQWNEVKFDKPVEVKEGVTYTYDVDCYDVPEGSTVLPVDNGAEVDGYSNLFSQDAGETFSTLMYNNDQHGNWMIGLKLDNGREERIPELKGYKVVVDQRNTFEVGADATSYDYKPTKIDAKNHRVRVDAVYDVKGTVRGTVVYFTFDVNSGINDATVSEITVNRNGSSIEVEGADVRSLSLVAADGKQVAAAQGNVLSVTHVPAGAYVLSMQLTNGEMKTLKLVVK